MNEEATIQILKYGKCRCGVSGIDKHECPYAAIFIPCSECNCCNDCKLICENNLVND